MPTTLKAVRPTSRGKVRCSLCWRIIGKGEQYERNTNIYDDRIYDWCVCDRCRLFLSEFPLWARLGFPDEGYTRDDLFEVEAETWREARLIALARHGWTVQGRLLPYPLAAPDGGPDVAEEGK